MESSVLIGYLGGGRTEVTERFVGVLDRGYPVGLTSVILQEVVQGISSEREFEQVSDYLGSQTFYHPQDPVESYKEAARMYFGCRRAGITIRSTIDCLIVCIAIEHDLLLLQDDRDFEKMAGAIPELSLAWFGGGPSVGGKDRLIIYNRGRSSLKKRSRTHARE